MNCEKCGTPIEEGGAFCSNCGAPVPAAEPVAEPVAEVAAEPVAEVTAEPVAEVVAEPVAEVVAEPVAEQPIETVEAVPTNDPGKGLGIAALVLGICSLFFGIICNCTCLGLGSIVSVITAIVGLILGILANKKSAAVGIKNKKAKVGIILSIVGIVFSVVLPILIFVVSAIFGVGANLSMLPRLDNTFASDGVVANPYY